MLPPYTVDYDPLANIADDGSCLFWSLMVAQILQHVTMMLPQLVDDGSCDLTSVMDV